VTICLCRFNTTVQQPQLSDDARLCWHLAVPNASTRRFAPAPGTHKRNPTREIFCDRRIVSQLLDRAKASGSSIASFADRKVSCEARAAKSGGDSKSCNSFQQRAKVLWSLRTSCSIGMAAAPWQ
jgi:hypothetical protein